MPPALDVDDLTKHYGTTQALDGVSFTLAPGECLALVGPNGAGKSTLMACLATLTEPTRGDARIFGASIRQAPGQVRRRLGIAFQTPLTAKHLTAEEVLIHHARLHALSRADARNKAATLLSFVGLADRESDRVRTFSGGMKRRLDLARVLMTDPDLLLLDEPTSGLDPRGRAELHDRLRSLLAEDATILLATHDLDEAARLADRVGILDEGHLLTQDTPDALARNTAHRILEIKLEPATSAQDVQTALHHEDVTVNTRNNQLEARLQSPDAPTPSALLERLDAAALAYEEATVRRPNLGDVFFDLTGHPFHEAAEPEAPA